MASIGRAHGRADAAAGFQGNEGPVLRPHIIGGRADDLVVGPLLDDVGAPAGGPSDHEQRREHGGRHPHQMVRDRAEPVEIGEHLLGFAHDLLDALGGESARNLLDDHVARVGHGVGGMAEADHHFLGGDAAADVRFRLGRIGVALLDLESDLVGAPVLRPAQRPDGPGDGGLEIRSGAGDGARREGGSVELVLRIEDQRGVHGLHMRLARDAPVKQMEDVAADGFVVAFHLDAPAVLRE